MQGSMTSAGTDMCTGNTKNQNIPILGSKEGLLLGSNMSPKGQIGLNPEN